MTEEDTRQAQETMLDIRFQRLKALITTHLNSKDELLYNRMIDDLGPDRLDTRNGYVGDQLLGLRRAPAAKGNHHAFEGGLVYHYLEMWDIWTIWANRFYLRTTSHMNDDRVLRGIINHDLHKAYRYYRLVSTAPWQVELATDYRKQSLEPSDTLVIENVKTIQILNHHGITMDDEQMNALLWSEGGFSKTKPQWCSILAKLLYLLDEFSGNVIGRIEKGTWLDHRNPTG